MKGKVIFIFLLNFFIFSCATTNLNLKELIPISDIANIETAQKALIIAQEIRLSYMRVVKEQVKLGLKPSEILNDFEEKDKKFRHVWGLADTVVTKGEEHIDDFKRLYQELINIVTNLKQIKESEIPIDPPLGVD